MVETGKRRLATAPKWSGTLDDGAQAHLVEALAANAGDAASWAVYADLLQTAGHPRGDLISVMLEREQRPSPRLFEAQRRQLGLHGAALMPAALAHTAVIAWRRGFVSELRLDDPAQLAVVRDDPTLRFVETATLVIGAWTAWRAALAGMRLPWHALRIETTARLDVAPLLAACPGVATLRITGAPELGWDGARGDALRRLVLVDAGEVAAFAGATLPALDELCLLGDSEPSDALLDSAHWHAARRRVLASEALALVPDVAPHYDDEVEAVPSVAFFVIGQAVAPQLLQKLATRLSIAQLSARIAGVPGHPATVIQLFGAPDLELLPYGLAIALQNVLPATPPIALVEIDEDRAARFLVLADPPVRGTQPRPDEVARRALDLALGYDPGPMILKELLETLASHPIERLLGDAPVYQLTMIDPATAPVVVVEEPAPDDDDDRDEDEDWDDDDGLEAQYVEPIALPEDDVVDAEDEPVEELLALTPGIETEEALVVPPDRSELWSEFHEHWEDRAVAIDDEPGEARWPDPERVQNEHPLDLDRQIAPASCARHVRDLDHCSGCGVMFCVECGGEDVCAACFAATTVRDAEAEAIRRASSTS